MKRLAYILLAGLPLLGVGQEPKAFTQEWVDQQWVTHLQWRLDHPETHPVEVEIYCRDLLKIVPVEPATADKLVEYYVLFRREPAMAAMAARYARLLDPASPLTSKYWDQIENACDALPLNPETDAFPGDAMLNYEQALSDALEQLNRGRLVPCENNLRTILFNYPRHPTTLKHLGSLYVMKKEWAMSTMLYGYARAFAPDDPDLENNYALCLDKIGRTSDALAILDTQFEREPRAEYLARNCGRLAMKLEKTDEALDYYSKWVEHHPNSIDGWLSYGEVLIIQDKDLLAQAAFARANDLDDEHPVPLRRLAEISARRDRPKELLKWVKQLKAVIPASEFERFLSQAVFENATEMKEEVLRESP
jgi:tetratricopeptide (TPR) repeat protein